MKELVGFVSPNLCKTLASWTTSLAQVLDIEVWVSVVDHPGLKMPGSIDKVKKLPVVLCWYMFYIVHYFNNCPVPAMCITVSLSIHKSS